MLALAVRSLWAGWQLIMEQAKLVGASAVRELCGNISDMTLWRWVNDPALGFPAPIRIQRRRYWREVEMLAWLESREVAA